MVYVRVARVQPHLRNPTRKYPLHLAQYVCCVLFRVPWFKYFSANIRSPVHYFWFIPWFYLIYQFIKSICFFTWLHWLYFQNAIFLNKVKFHIFRKPNLFHHFFGYPNSVTIAPLFNFCCHIISIYMYIQSSQVEKVLIDKVNFIISLQLTHLHQTPNHFKPSSEAVGDVFVDDHGQCSIFVNVLAVDIRKDHYPIAKNIYR